MPVRPVKTQISLGIRPVWSESLLCAQLVAKGQRFLHADSEDSDQTGRMPRLIWVFAGCTPTLLVLSCRGAFNQSFYQKSSKTHRICSNKRPLLINVPTFQCGKGGQMPPKLILEHQHFVYLPNFCLKKVFLELVNRNTPERLLK